MSTYNQIKITLLIIIILLSGCVAQTRVDTDHTSKAEEEQAITYLNAGNFDAAAEEYLRLSENNKSLYDYYLLKSATAFVRGNRYDQAETVLNELHIDKLNSLQQSELNIDNAHIAVSKNDANGALKKLEFELPAEAPLDIFSLYYSAQASAYQLSGNSMQAVHALIKFGQFLNDPASSQMNNNKIWDLLSRISITNLEQELSVTTGSNANLAGWLELAIIAKSRIYSQPDLEDSVTTWSQKYPGHPAQAEIIEKILELGRQANTRPEQIALLLPFDSQYQDISNAIREGFISAWYESPGNKPVIKVYNSSSQNIVDIYNTAVNDGADFVVGPLEKEAVSALLNAGNITVNTLALNQIFSEETGQNQQNQQTVTPSNLYQFGLIPEDEARHAAERAWFDGHANALIITPDTTWGERIYNAFSTRWIELGGIIVERVRIPAGIQDFSTPVKQLLNIDNSEQRTKQLVATLHRKIESEPRYRRDADIIFLAATPLMARQIVPQLRYYQVNDIKTYSISSIYSGNYDPQANSDINDVIFSDMPWMLDNGQEYSPLQQSLNKYWNQSDSPYRRFYAFGIDAYRIIPELGRLYTQHEWFQGVTGKLTVTPQKQIQRKSAWAKFVEGSPQLLDSE